ncbi:MAG: NAD-dependent epimerase/dehydratase family protein, partial [Rhodospirillaceae bacterium]
MSKILITGATGFVGQALCRHLRKAGHTLSGTSRNRSLRAGPENIPLYYVQADQADADWTHAVTGADAVVHLAARVH